MDKEVSYTSGSIICFEVNTNQRVAIQSSRNLAPIIDLQFPVIEPYARLMGRWIIECKNNVIFLRENNSSIQDDRIVISFEQQDVDILLKCNSEDIFQDIFTPIDNGIAIQRVTQIYVYPREVGKIKIQTSEVINGRNASASESTQRTHPTNSSEELVENLKNELKKEKAKTKRLQEIVDSRLDDMLHVANEKSQTLSGDNRTKLQTVNRLGDEVGHLTQEGEILNSQINEMSNRLAVLHDQIQDGNTQISNLQEQINELNSQKELLDLDCSAAEAQLKEIKQHVHLDKDTLVLLEDGGRLKHGTISKALTEMEKEIEKVEKRIAFILKIRSKYNQVVEDSIFNGDGTILISDEAGGNSDGI